MTIREHQAGIPAQIAAWPHTVLECGGDPSNWWEPRLATATEALRALMSNPHLILGDLVYEVYEREGEGWEGPAVKQWKEAVNGARAVLDALDK